MSFRLLWFENHHHESRYSGDGVVESPVVFCYLRNQFGCGHPVAKRHTSRHVCRTEKEKI